MRCPDSEVMQHISSCWCWLQSAAIIAAKRPLTGNSVDLSSAPRVVAMQWQISI